VSPRWLLGLDLGGGGIRALAVDPGGGRTATAFRSVAPVPRPELPMGVDLDAPRLWQLLGEAVGEALARAGGDASDVVGIAASAMRHGNVVLDGEGRVILATPNRDARGLACFLELAASQGPALHRRTGHWPNPVQPLARLLWLAREAPGDLERAALHLSLSDWLAWRLCGEAATEPSQAGESGVLEIEAPGWAWDVIDRLELPRRLFPPLRRSGERLGALLPESAEALGLPAGIAVAVGGADTQCGLLGAGVLAPGRLAVIGGTSAPVLQVQAEPVLDEAARLWSVYHLLPERWALESNAGGVGETLDWIAGLLHPDVAYPILHLVSEAEGSLPGASGMLSTLGADVMDARQIGLPVGTLTASPLTTAGDAGRRRHLARAVLEGMAFGLRANIEQIEAVSGRRSGSLRFTGGLSRSALLARLLAESTGRPVEVTATPDTTALGAAICAGVGAGVFADLEAGAAALADVAEPIEPDAERVALYEELYRSWQDVRAARSEADAKAAAVAMRGLAASAARAVPAASPFRPRILVTADLDPDGLAALREIGEVEHASFRTSMRLLTGPALSEALRGVHVFVTEVDVVDAAALLEAPDLRVVVACRGDAVNVDVEACTALGIPVVNTPGRNADAVADLTLAFLLALARKLPEANAFLREPGGEAGDMGRMGRAFTRLRGHELWGRTVGLVGFGAVGRKVAQRLRPFDARCLVHDPFVAADAVRLAGGEPAELDELLRASDFVSLHAAVTAATRGLVGERELGLMRDGSFLVNTARAALVDQDALVRALESGHLGGAALDVFAVEPPASDDPLLRLPSVIATPHVGGNTVEVAAHQGRIALDELERMRRGTRPRHLLNPACWEAFRWDASRPAPGPELRERLARGSAPAVSDLDRASRAPRDEATRRAAPRREQARAASTLGGAAVEARRKMEAILGELVAGIRQDAALADFAARGQELVLHFTLSDLDLDFHLGFAAGQVVAELGAPSPAASVELKMKADLLDGMFTGRRNAMQAAMQGELSFSGDAAKAMTLQQVQRDLARLYQAARAKVGDPGDLAALATPGGAAPKAAPAASADVRREMVAIVNELYAVQLITATGGNVSVRIPDCPDEAWITPSQLFKGDLVPEILVRIGMDGRALDEGARSPSSEALMHTAVLKAKPEANAVIHCHAPNATVLVNAGLPFLAISTEAAFFRNIGRIPFVMPGTQELADAIVEAMGDGWAVLMQNHGLLVAGRSLRRAADMAEIIERTAQVIIGCYAVGKEPPTLPDEVVETLARYGDLMA
jgi:autoinducer 2 (AI-2) kinase